MNNNINHTSININNNILNNGSNTNATITTTTTTTTADTNATTTTTTTTTTNMINHLASVSVSNNSDVHNNYSNNTNNTTNKNKINNSNTPLKDLTNSQLPTNFASDSNMNSAINPKTNESELTIEMNEHVRAESAKNTNDSRISDNCDDKYDKFMTEGYKHNNNKNENKAEADIADREKDLSQSMKTTSTATIDTPTIAKATQRHSKLDESNEQTHIESQRKSASVSINGTSNNDCSNSNNSGSNGKNNNISHNFLHDSTVTYNNGNISQQILLHITEPRSEEKLATLRTQQKLRHSQRRLRTKALLDSLPQSLKMLARNESVNVTLAINDKSSTNSYEALLANSDELLQRMSINNPFYRFRKQSDSLKEMRALTCGKRRRLRKARSEADIFYWLQWGNEYDKRKGRERNKECCEGDGVIQERYAQVILDNKGRVKVDRDTINYVRDYNAPFKRGETAVQLTDADGSVVVVLDNKLPNIVCKPKSLSSLEDLLYDANTEDEQYATRGYLLDALASERAHADSTRETDSSTVITNPFSIFLDDDAQILAVSTRIRTTSSASQQQRPLKKRQRSERSIRRLFETSTDTSSASKREPTKQQTGFTNARQHFLHGIPVSHFERQDFVNTSAALALHESTKSSKLKSKLVFKNLSLRKLHKSASGLPASKIHHHVNTTDTISELSSLPQLKKLKISYPNRTQSIHSALDVSSSARLSIGLVSPVGGSVSTSKHSYFERLQAKTRQGLQKLRDKCRNFKHNAGQQQYATANRGFSTLAKDDSFRFISDRARISSYESKCAALNAHGNRPQATIYKSYKSEIDLSKNLHYLDTYLEENFEQNLRCTKESAHSVGRVAAGRRQEKQNQLKNFQTKETTSKSPQYARAQRGRTHKRSLSVAQKSLPADEQKTASISKASNYENLGTLPTAKRGCSDSLSSSDYASVFSGPTLAVEPATPLSALGVTDGDITPTPADDTSSSAGLRYEHPKMSQYFFNKLTPENDDHDLLRTVKRYSSSETATCFFNATSEDDMDDEQDNFMHLAAGRDAALLVDYRRAANLDDSIRILVNEAEETDFQQDQQQHAASEAVTKEVRELTTTDWYQERQQQELSAANERNFLLACNENLAESNFYRSLNQHLQEQQQQRDRDLHIDVAVNSEVEVGIETATARFETAAVERRISGDGAGDGGSKDFHYESYLEHFHRAKSGGEARKANSIGYDNERVDVDGVGVLDDGENTEHHAGVYMTRSAFRHAARGPKAGGSAYELRHSALLLLNEHLGKGNERNKDGADMAMTSNRAAYYARQFYGVGTDISSADTNRTQEARTSGGDKMKLPAAALKPFTANSALKSRQRDMAADGLTLAIAAGEKQRSFVGTATQLDINDTSNLLTTTTTEVPTYNLSALLRECESEQPTIISGKNDFYFDDAIQNAASISTTAANPSTKIELQLDGTDGGGVKAHMYFQQSKQDQQQKQSTTAFNAMFIESGKQAGDVREDAILYGDASNRQMLDNMRRHYQQQQQQKQQYRQKSTNSVSSSLSLSTSSSSNSSVSQPVMYNLQQQQQHQQRQQLLLPVTKEHAKYMKMQHQQQLTPGAPNTAYHTRRSSSASNASSSDNFDTFIALRNTQQTTNTIELASTAATAITALQTDYLLSTQRTNCGNNSSINNSAQNAYQQRQLSGVHARTHNPTTHHHYPTSPSSGGSSGTVPLISALNYYGTSGGSSSISDGTQHAAYASSTASASASASASSSSSSSSTNQRYALNTNTTAIASNKYALLAQMHYGNKVGGSAAAGVSSGGSATLPLISPAYPTERKPFVLEYEC